MVLDYLPQSKYFYDMLPKKNTIPAFSGHYFERKDESTLKSPLSGFKPDNIRLAHNPSC